MKSIQQETGPLHSAEEIAEALQFLGPIMRPGKPELLGPEYPLVYGMPGRGGVRLIREEGIPVAGAAFAAFEAVTQPVTGLRVGAVGSVGTHPAHRGKGHARHAVELCENDLRDRDCAVALLWSQVPEVFRKLGYTEVGVEIAFSIEIEEGLKLPRPAGVVLPFDADRDLQDCAALYKGQPARVRRKIEEFRRLVTVPGMELWIHRRATKTTAYGIVGKGTDFPETMHEWAGDIDGVVAILRHHLAQNHRERMTVISSGARPDFVAALSGWGMEPIYGVMGMMKILDPQGLLRSVAPALEALGLVARQEADGFVLEAGTARMSLDPSRFLRFLFGYRGVTGEHLEAARVFQNPKIKSSPPVQMFFWGLDSI